MRPRRCEYKRRKMLTHLAHASCARTDSRLTEAGKPSSGAHLQRAAKGDLQPPYDIRSWLVIPEPAQDSLAYETVNSLAVGGSGEQIDFALLVFTK